MRLVESTGKVYFLRGTEITIGRREENDIVFDDARTSGRHAVITRRGDEFVLTDAGSTNGTWVNGERLQGAYKLQNGDIVQVGRITLTFRTAEVDDDPSTQHDLADESSKAPAAAPRVQADSGGWQDAAPAARSAAAPAAAPPRQAASVTPPGMATPPPPAAPSAPPAQVRTGVDRTLLLLIEVGAGLFGFAGVGWVVAGETRRGLITLVAGFIGLAVGLVLSVVLPLLFCLVIPAWLGVIGFSTWQLAQFTAANPARFS